MLVSTHTTTNHKASGIQDTYQDTTSFVSTYTLFDRHLLAGFSPQSARRETTRLARCEPHIITGFFATRRFARSRHDWICVLAIAHHSGDEWDSVAAIQIRMNIFLLYIHHKMIQYAAIVSTPRKNGSSPVPNTFRKRIPR